MNAKSSLKKRIVRQNKRIEFKRKLRASIKRRHKDFISNLRSKANNELKRAPSLYFAGRVKICVTEFAMGQSDRENSLFTFFSLNAPLEKSRLTTF